MMMDADDLFRSEEMERAINGMVEDIVAKAEDDWRDRFPPKVIRVYAPYGKYVEYGTPPRPKSPRPDTMKLKHHDSSDLSIARRSESFERISRWAESKLKLKKSDPDWKHNAYLIWKSIMDNGCPPSPFARPAMDDTIEAIDNGQFDMSKDGDLRSSTIAYWTRDRMLDYLSNPLVVRNTRGLPTNWTYNLANSIAVEDATWEDAPTLSIDIIDDMEDPYVRDSSDIGYDARWRYMKGLMTDGDMGSWGDDFGMML
jgi:hypothetical protein